MSLLTKVASGIAYGDVSNLAVRNILTEISKVVYGGITEQEMEDTMEFFGWKCPYTGRDLKESIESKDGSYATDHLCPQNRYWCGLNIKGNLVIVDSKANSAKGRLDIKTFLVTDSEFWDKLGVDKATRLKRLEKIEEFQRLCGYDPDKIQREVSALLVSYYDQVRIEQERMIATCLDSLCKIGLSPLAKPSTPATTPVATTPKKLANTPELIFHPADEQLFKEKLLERKKAHFVLTYESGKVLVTPWDAQRFDPSSKLKGNIQSKTFWRSRVKEGLIKVEAFVD